MTATELQLLVLIVANGEVRDGHAWYDGDLGKLPGHPSPGWLAKHVGAMVDAGYLVEEARPRVNGRPGPAGRSWGVPFESAHGLKVFERITSLVTQDRSNQRAIPNVEEPSRVYARAATSTTTTAPPPPAGIPSLEKVLALEGVTRPQDQIRDWTFNNVAYAVRELRDADLRRQVVPNRAQFIVGMAKAKPVRPLVEDFEFLAHWSDLPADDGGRSPVSIRRAGGGGA